MLRSNPGRVWRCLLSCFLIAWTALIAPNLTQAQRLCDALAHESAYAGADAHAAAAGFDHDEAPAQERDAHHAKHGHCHSPLAHDQADRARGWCGIEQAYVSSLTAVVESGFRSHIPSLPERPPKA